MSIRLRGLVEAVIGACVFGLLAFWIFHPGAYPLSYYPTGPVAAILIGVPGMLAIVGVTELLTRKSITTLEATWTALPGWKKGLLGTLLVIGGGTVAFAIVGVLVS